MRIVTMSVACMLGLLALGSQAQAQLLPTWPGAFDPPSGIIQGTGPGGSHKTATIAPGVLDNGVLGAAERVPPGILGQLLPGNGGNGGNGGQGGSGGSGGQGSGGKQPSPPPSNNDLDELWKKLADPETWLKHFGPGRRPAWPSDPHDHGSGFPTPPVDPGHTHPSSGGCGQSDQPLIPSVPENHVVNVLNDTRYKIPFRIRGRVQSVSPDEAVSFKLGGPERLVYPRDSSGQLLSQTVDRGLFRFVETDEGEIRLVRVRVKSL